VDIPPGECVNCRYDLAGLQGDRCPECGAAISRATTHQDRPFSHLILFCGAVLWGLAYTGVTLKTYSYGVYVEGNDRLWRVGVATLAAVHIALTVVAYFRDSLMDRRSLLWQLAWWLFLLTSISLAVPACIAGWEGEPRI
jgi:hypothetical protein